MDLKVLNIDELKLVKMTKHIDRESIENAEFVDVYFEEGQIEVVLTETRSFFIKASDINLCKFEGIIDYSEHIGTVGCMITIGTPEDEFTIDFKMKDIQKAVEVYKMLLLICGFKRN